MRPIHANCECERVEKKQIFKWHSYRVEQENDKENENE